jgi:hypothetical protein
MEKLDNFLQKKGKKLKPKILFYGQGGIGKTTIASQFEDVVFAITEDGINNIDVPSLPRFETWNDVLQGLNIILTTEHNYKTLVIDTIDGIESLCSAHVLESEFRGRKTGKDGYNSWAQGDRTTSQFMKEIKHYLSRINREKDMTILLLGHEGVTKKKNPLGEEYGVRTANLISGTWNDFYDWSDIVGYLCREIKTFKDSKDQVKAKLDEAGRFIYFEGDAGLEVKTRAGYEMPPRVDLSYQAFAEYLFADTQKKLADRLSEIREMLKEIAEPEIEEKVKGFLGEKPNLLTANQTRNRLQTIINERKS